MKCHGVESDCEDKNNVECKKHPTIEINVGNYKKTMEDVKKGVADKCDEAFNSFTDLSRRRNKSA